MEMLFTFELIDGRRVTYGGASEAQAFNRARAYHLDAVLPVFGVPAEPCTCVSIPWSRPEEGFHICACGGVIGTAVARMGTARLAKFDSRTESWTDPSGDDPMARPSGR